MTLQQVNQILEGDALSVLKTLPSESIDCIVTSPPYWALRDYQIKDNIVWDSDSKTKCDHDFSITHKMEQTGGKTEGYVGNYSDDRLHFSSKSYNCSKCNAWKGQLGQEPTIELFIKHMIQIFDECKRILKPNGTCWVVLGDTYSGNGINRNGISGGTCSKRVHLNNQYKPRENLEITEKSLCMIPERFAIAMIDKGWILRNKIIWHKRNCMPSSAKDRFTIDYEYIYFFTKNQKYYFKTQYEPHQRDWGNEQSHWKNNTAKYVSVQGQSPRHFINGPNIEGRIKRSVWTINTKPFSEAHFAVFPEELVFQCLNAGCKEDGIVLDPFMGSGTTAYVALKYNRTFLGIELNPEYIEIAKKRIDPYLNQSRIVEFVQN